MKLSIRKTIEVSVFLCAIVTSGYALSTTNFSSWTIPLLIISLGHVLVLRPHSRMDTRKLLCCVTWLIIGFFSTLASFSSENFNAYIHFALVVILALLISQRFPLEDMIPLFLRFMRMITWIAVGMWVLTEVVGINPPFPEIKNFNGAIYQTAVVWHRYRYAFNYSPRLIGVFWEPGLFATYLNVALVIELLKREYFNKSDVALFIVSILLTRSSAGYLLLCMVFFLPVLNYKGKWKAFLLFSLLIATILVGFYAGAIYKAIIGSNNPALQKFDLSSGNGASRLLSMQINISMLLEKPWFGYGLAGANNTYLDRMPLFGQIPQTSTTFYYTAAFGVLGILYTVFFVTPFICLRRSGRISGLCTLILIIIVIFIINKEPHTLFPFTYTVWFYLFDISGEKLNKNHWIKQKLN